MNKAMGSLMAGMGSMAAAGAVMLAPTASAGGNPVTSVWAEPMSAKYQISAPSAGYSDVASCESAVNNFYKTGDIGDVSASAVASSLMNVNSGWDTMCFKLPSGKYSWGKVGFNLKVGATMPSWLAAYKPVAGGSIANATMHGSYDYSSLASCVSTKAAVVAAIQAHGGSIISSQACLYQDSKNTYTYGAMSYVSANGYKVVPSDSAISTRPFVGVQVDHLYH